MSTHRREKEGAQITIADTARIAKRDYIENASFGQVGDLLNRLDQQGLDDLAIENERVFKWRFGFDARRACRRQVIDLKHKADWTDDEIRLLRRANYLVQGDAGIQLHPRRWGNRLGVGLVIALDLYMVLLLVIASAVGPPSWRLAMIQTSIVGLIIGVTWAFQRSQLTPTRILHRGLKAMTTDQHRRSADQDESDLAANEQ